MRPADDPAEDYKALVRRGYDRCAREYSGARSAVAPTDVAVLFERLPSGSRVLDLGCGGGVPIARELATHFEVTGVDFSEEQLRYARSAVPSANFSCCDALEFAAPDKSFDAIAAFYLLFHLPKPDQTALITRIARWLRPGGLFLGTISEHDEAPYTEEDFFGVRMFWTNYSRQAYEALFEEAGLRIVRVGAAGHGYHDADRVEHHPLVLAERFR